MGGLPEYAQFFFYLAVILGVIVLAGVALRVHDGWSEEVLLDRRAGKPRWSAPWKRYGMTQRGWEEQVMNEGHAMKSIETMSLPELDTIISNEHPEGRTREYLEAFRHKMSDELLPSAIAHRVADEWSGDSGDTRDNLEAVLTEALALLPPTRLYVLVGTEIIEEDWDEPLEGLTMSDTNIYVVMAQYPDRSGDAVLVGAFLNEKSAEAQMNRINLSATPARKYRSTEIPIADWDSGGLI
ncbi:MAG: hypothetical protein MZV49_24140 [Rhodopseudomonas palustris]|nr:hypothetical protein [Rhodopseudomonas palustris]